MKRRSLRILLAWAVAIPLALAGGATAANAATVTYKSGNATFSVWYLDSPGRSLVGGSTAWGATAPFVGVLNIQTLSSANGSVVATNSAANGGVLTHVRTTGTSRCNWTAVGTVQPGTQTSITCRSTT
jgi:hypothetical protein